MRLMDSFYVYIIFRPNGVPCYVGKGSGNRWRHHNRQRLGHPNAQMAGVYAAAGNAPLPVVMLHQDLAEETALEYERVLILAIGRADRGCGPLLNHTDGGDGVTAGGHSQEALAKMSAASRNRKITPEARARMSAAHKLAWQNETRRQQMSERVTGNTFSIGKIHSEATRQKMSDASKGKPKSDAHRASITAANRRRAAERRGQSA